MSLRLLSAVVGLALLGPVQAQIQGDAEAGAAKAGVCAACHALDGNSTNAEWPKLAGQHESYIARHLALFKSGERANAVMLGFAAALSEQDMHDIGAYFANQKGMPGTADEALAAEGAQLYRGGERESATPACMACHGPTGRGNPGAGYPAIAGQHAAYTKAQLVFFRGGGVHGKGENANAVMAGVAGELSPAIVVTRLATHVDHAVDAGAAA